MEIRTGLNKVITITIPEGYVIDKENSTDTRIKVKKVERKPEPMFTTEDGVDIFEGDHVYIVGENFKWLQMFVNENIRYSVGKRFAVKGNALDYILMNKPILSLQDLLNVWEADPEFNVVKNSKLFKRFKDLAKSKNK